MRRVARPLLLSLALVALPAPGRPACRDGLLSAAPSSRWSLESRTGVSWLVTPAGDPFFSVGVNTLNGGLAADDLAGRAAYRWSSFYPDLAAWLDAACTRVQAWGFNTASAWSLPPDLLRLPFIPDLELGRNSRFHWFDPFDPAMEERVLEAARRLVAPYRGSPYRIGYFSDNEVGWWNGALFSFYLEKPASNHTKRRLVDLLRARYAGDWSRFTRDFVPPARVASFADLLASEGAKTYLRPGGSGIQVVRDWTGVVAEHYYRLVRRALTAADPDALVFGDRLPIYYDPAAVRAMAPYVDAIATNYNVDSPDGWIARYYFDGLRRLSGDKPVVVSEWFFAAHENRSGNRNNGHLMTVPSQAERARGAAAAAERLAREPSVVGMHWFQYYDYPTGGRADGEDYDFGLVDIEDRPYDELVTALGSVNPRLAAIHREAAPAAVPLAAIPYARIDAGDRSLAEWPKERALVTGMAAPAPEIVFGDVYLAWDGYALFLATISMDYWAPDLMPSGKDVPLEECFHVDLGIDAGAGPQRFALYIVPPRSVSARDTYLMHARLCRIDDGRCAPVRDAVASYFGADQPRITAEVRLPWRALGVERPPERSLRIEVAATAFHRSRWMSWSGRAPRIAMRDPAHWRAVPLSPRVD
jgi:hypothetical protein